MITMRKGALALLVAAQRFGAVVTVRVVERTDVESGKAFGAAGPYEQLVTRAYFAVDPRLPANANIVYLQLAPKNGQGLVEFSADVVVFKPREPKSGNGTALVDIVNRGGMT